MALSSQAGDPVNLRVARSTATGGGAPRPAVAPAKPGWYPAHRGTSGDSLRGGSSPGEPCSSPPRGDPQLPGARPHHRAHLLAVRGRALFPQAAPVEQVPGLQVQGAGPRQERPGRATVGAHGSCRPRGSGSAGAAEREGERAGRRLPRRARRCPRPQRRARGCRLRAATARCALGPEEAGRRPRGGPGGRNGRRDGGREAPAPTVAAASAAAARAAAETPELFPGRQ